MHDSEPNRYLTLTKKKAKPIKERDSFPLEVEDVSIRNLDALLDQQPLTDHERSNQLMPKHRTVQTHHATLPFSLRNGARRRVPIPSIANETDEFRATRMNLPIYPHRQQILDAIDANQVVVISGETGTKAVFPPILSIFEHF